MMPPYWLILGLKCVTRLEDGVKSAHEKEPLTTLPPCSFLHNTSTVTERTFITSGVKYSLHNSFYSPGIPVFLRLL